MPFHALTLPCANCGRHQSTCGKLLPLPRTPLYTGNQNLVWDRTNLYECTYYIYTYIQCIYIYIIVYYILLFSIYHVHVRIIQYNTYTSVNSITSTSFKSLDVATSIAVEHADHEANDGETGTAKKLGTLLEARAAQRQTWKI